VGISVAAVISAGAAVTPAAEGISGVEAILAGAATPVAVEVATSVAVAEILAAVVTSVVAVVISAAVGVTSAAAAIIKRGRPPRSVQLDGRRGWRRSASPGSRSASCW
jgi:hypothetical protein